MKAEVQEAYVRYALGYGPRRKLAPDKRYLDDVDWSDYDRFAEEYWAKKRRQKSQDFWGKPASGRYRRRSRRRRRW